jgi:chemotaxis protein CheD
MNTEFDFNQDSLTSHYFLQPGYIFVPDQAVSISTVIGSGVSICVFDRKKQIGGMNHFQHPYMNTRGKTTALYGNVATMTLLKMMKARESSVRHIEAQIFGGAYHLEKSQRDIGHENIEMAQKILSKNKIAIAVIDKNGRCSWPITPRLMNITDYRTKD